MSLRGLEVTQTFCEKSSFSRPIRSMRIKSIVSGQRQMAIQHTCHIAIFALVCYVWHLFWNANRLKLTEICW